MPTLAELRAQKNEPDVPRSTATVTLLDGQHILTELKRLTEQHSDLLTSQPDDDEPSGPPQKTSGGGIQAKVAKIKAQIRTTRDSLADYQGEVSLRGMSVGDWQRFKDDNPPREGNKSDDAVTAGYVNATALMESLGQFVVGWEGEDLTAGDWDGWLAARIAPADIAGVGGLVYAVVAMQETRLNRVPKSQSDSSDGPTNETA